MSKGKIFLIILLTILGVIVVFFVIRRNDSLISPIPKQIGLQAGVQQSSPAPLTPSYNPPKEIKYDSSTDLQKELDSIEPQVLDSDFE